MLCDANSLLELAKCWRCADPGNLADYSLALACVAAGGTPPSPPPAEGTMLGAPDENEVFGDALTGDVFGEP